MRRAAYLTVGGTRQQIAAIERQGFATHIDERSGPGRPYHRYGLTESGESLFPRADKTAAEILIGAMNTQPPEMRAGMIEAVVDSTTNVLGGRARVDGCSSSLAAVQGALEERGYLPKVTDEADAQHSKRDRPDRPRQVRADAGFRKTANFVRNPAARLLNAPLRADELYTIGTLRPHRSGEGGWRAIDRDELRV